MLWVSRWLACSLGEVGSRRKLLSRGRPLGIAWGTFSGFLRGVVSSCFVFGFFSFVVVAEIGLSGSFTFEAIVGVCFCACTRSRTTCFTRAALDEL